jgi:hypothetical protein
MKKQTLVVDLESMANVPQYQKDIFDKWVGGIAAGTMNVISVGRQTGKSMISSYYYSASKQRSISVMGSNLCKEIFLPMHPATKPKYQFSRAKWYSAEITGHATWRMSDEYNEIIEWCTEHFGKHPDKPDAWSRWWVGLGVINFRDEKDFVFYKLRWA